MQGQITGNQRLSSAIKSHLLLFLLQYSLSKKGTGWGISHPDWVSRKGFKPELGLKLMSLKMVSGGHWGVDASGTHAWESRERVGAGGEGGLSGSTSESPCLSFVVLLSSQPGHSHFLWGDLTRSWCKEGKLPARSWRSHSADAGWGLLLRADGHLALAAVSPSHAWQCFISAVALGSLLYCLPHGYGALPCWWTAATSVCPWKHLLLTFLPKNMCLVTCVAIKAASLIKIVALPAFISHTARSHSPRWLLCTQWVNGSPPSSPYHSHWCHSGLLPHTMKCLLWCVDGLSPPDMSTQAFAGFVWIPTCCLGQSLREAAGSLLCWMFAEEIQRESRSARAQGHMQPLKVELNALQCNCNVWGHLTCSLYLCLSTVKPLVGQLSTTEAFT